MTVETISASAAMILSLIMSYVPGISTKYQQLSSEYKSLVMVGMLLLVAIGTVALACAGLSADLRAVTTGFRIPMPGGTESLNVGAACAITLFERVRQRQAL